MKQRYLEKRIYEALEDTPAVFLQGPRQAGKSTLVQSLTAQHPDTRFVTFDDLGPLSSARRDPEGFLDLHPGLTILDEVQRAPGLFLPLKAVIDRDRRPGQFLLTGSANILLLPQLADHLVGRMEMLTLFPFSQGEILETEESLIDRLFDGGDLSIATEPVSGDRIERIVAGGFPEAVARDGRRRDAWFRAYINTLLQREVHDLAQIRDLAALPRLLSFLATRTGSLLNIAEVARTLDLPQTTLKRHLALFEGLFLVERIPAWSSHLGKRLVKTPKLTFIDSGLAAHLLGATQQRLVKDPLLRGKLAENFVASELRKQMGWSDNWVQLYHFRTHGGREVDLVLEDRAGRVAGVEVKLGRTVGGRDFKGLSTLAELAGDNFVAGIVLYGGTQSLPFGNRLWALPLEALWS